MQPGAGQPAFGQMGVEGFGEGHHPRLAAREGRCGAGAFQSADARAQRRDQGRAVHRQRLGRERVGGGVGVHRG